MNKQSLKIIGTALLLSAAWSAAPLSAGSDATAANATKSEVAVESEAAADTELPFMDLLTVAGDRADITSHFDDDKWTLVMIWATDCHVCKEQKPMISAAYKERKDLDLNVFGIALDGRERLQKVQRYIEDHQPAFPNYVGDFAIVSFNYEVLTEEALRGTPTYLLFNPQNELMAAQPGRIGKEALIRFIEKNS